MSRVVRRVALIGLAGLVVVVGAWYTLFWRSETSHLKAEQKAEAQAASNVASLQGQVAALTALQKKMPAERAALAKLREAVPDGPSLDQLIDAITTAAAQGHVALNSIGTPEPSGWGGSTASGPAPATSGAGPQSLSVSIGVNGTPAGLLKFVTALDSQPRLFVVDSFSLSGVSQPGGAGPAGPQGGAQGGTSLTVEAFYVSAQSSDAASQFPLISGRGGALGGAAIADAAAKSNAIDALSYEKAYYATAGAYIDATTPLGAKALGGGPLPWASTRAPGAGQVAVVAGRLAKGDFLAGAPGGKGKVLLVESLSQSGTCFYISDYLRGSTDVEGYAQSSGGCRVEVAFPVARPKAGAAVPVKAKAPLVAADWYSTW
jgi:Tfp pilus assembly protein PilO